MTTTKPNVLLGAMGGMFIGGCATGLAYNIVNASGAAFILAGALGILAGAALVGAAYARAK
ncbi:TPA: hypothetical protein ACYLN4_000644 [Burkholderia lata]